MRRAWGLVLLAACLGGCTPPYVERARLYGEDGLAQYRLGNYNDARESFELALAQQPDDVNLIYNLGSCYDRLGDFIRARECYEQCLRQVPNHEPCRHALAALLVREGRTDDAARLAEDWLAREPRLAAPYIEDAWLWRQRGDLRRAQGRLQQALEIDPRSTRALVELGQVYEALGRPDRAVTLYERCLCLDPNQPEVAQRLGLMRGR